MVGQCYTHRMNDNCVNKPAHGGRNYIIRIESGPRSDVIRSICRLMSVANHPRNLTEYKITCLQIDYAVCSKSDATENAGVILHLFFFFLLSTRHS